MGACACSRNEATTVLHDKPFTLTATPGLDGFDGCMVVSAEASQAGPAYDNFELYTIHTSLTGEMGSRQPCYRINGACAIVLGADFDFEGTSRVITFPGGLDHGGDSVQYEKEGDTRRFLWQQVVEALNHDVAWDVATRAGSIVGTNYNGGEIACWDADPEDAACPN